jgi:hypothetical protein
MCVHNEGYEIDLTIHKVYRAIPDRRADQHGLVRIVDDTDEDYFYPMSMFLAVELSAEAEQTFGLEVA